MKKSRVVAGLAGILCAAVLAVVSPAQQAQAFATKHTFNEIKGMWKAVCDKEKVSGKSFCRIMTIDKFGEGKNANFVNFGIAWAPDAMGLIVATYMGFRKETDIVVGVDKHKRMTFRAPIAKNNLSIGPIVSKKLVAQMLKGHKMVLYFTPTVGRKHLSLAELKAFKELHQKVQKIMAPSKEKTNEDKG